MRLNDLWSAALAVAREGRETIALGRLAHACKPLQLSPSFSIVDRDRLLAGLTIKDGTAMINAGLKALRKIGARNPELAINPCQKILSAAEQAAQAHRVRFGTQFEASIQAYVTASTAPTDAHGRKRIVPKSIAEKHPNSLRLAAGICADAALPVTDVADLLQAGHRKAIIDHYGDPELGAGGRNVVLNVLKQVATYKGDKAAFDDLVRQTKSMGKTSHSLPERTLLALAPFHNLRRQTAMLGRITAVAASLANGWPTVWPLRRCQAALALLLMFYLIANPDFVYSIGFDRSDDAMRDTPWGPRPRLVAGSAPHEPLEDALPKTLIAIFDIYWAQMPPALRASREVFVTDAGDRTTKQGFVKRLQMLLTDLEIELTPHMLVDLGVMNMIWLKKSQVEMAIKTRFSGIENFRKRYKVLQDTIAALRRGGKLRPGTSRSIT